MWENLLRNRPAVFAGLALAIGIALSRELDARASAYTLGFVVVAGIAVTALRKYSALGLPLLFLSFLLVGALLLSNQERSYRDTSLARLSQLNISHAVLTGRVLEENETGTAHIWVFATDSIGMFPGTPIAQRGTILLRLSKLDSSRIPLPPEGSRVRVFATLEPFREATNPHEFAGDRKLQMNTQTEAQGIIRSRYDYYILAPPEKKAVSRIVESFATIHNAISRILDTAIVDGPSRGFVEAVVLGDRADMEKETLNDFSASGVSHILAVSGFNVAIVALVIAQLLRLFGLYWHRPRVILTMIGILFYSAIVGFQPSVVRALLMIELYYLALLIERKPDPLNIIMGAAAINLLVRPADLFDVGFQLSYAAVLGLILIAPRLKRLFVAETDATVERARTKRERILARIGDTIAMSLGATFASYPIIASHFYRVSFISILANVPVIPLSALITALGFLLIPITALSTWAGQLYGEAITYLTRGLLFLTKLCAHLPFASHSAAPPSWIYLVFLFVVTVYALRAIDRKQFVGRLSLSVSCFFVLWILHLPITDLVLDKNEGKLQVLFYDVGQGDCILIHTPSNNSYLVDFGTLSRTGYAVAERTVLPFLRAENETHITAGFISHMHRDHFGGAPTIVEQCDVGTMCTSGERVPDAVARTLEHDVRERNIRCQVLSRGDTLHLDSSIILYVLHPDRHVSTTSVGQHINSGSLAFKLVYRNTGFLFLGDVERSEEETMRESYGDFLHSTVVKVAHHGSLTSSSREFVTTTHPTYAVISVGERNTFGHPAPAIVKRWMTAGASVLRTDRDGAVLLTSDGDTVTRVDWH